MKTAARIFLVLAVLAVALTVRAATPTFTITPSSTATPTSTITPRPAGVTFQNSTPSTAAATFNFDCQGLDHTALFFVYFNATGNSTLVGVTYGSQAMSKLASLDDGGSGPYFEAWGLLAPATGSNAFTYSFSGGATPQLVALSYDGVDSFGENTHTRTTGSSVVYATHSATYGETYMVSLIQSLGGTWTVPSAVTARNYVANNNPLYFCGDTVPIVGTQAFTFASSVSGNLMADGLGMLPNGTVLTYTPTLTPSPTPTPYPVVVPFSNPTQRLNNNICPTWWRE